MFSQAGFAGKCAIVTSYQPNASEIKGEETGEGLTEKLKPAPSLTLGVLIGLAILLIAAVRPDGVAPFIYFQF